MDTAFAWLLALLAALAIFDAAAAFSGVDSRDSAGDDHRR
jgi:hypothetical protein